MIQFKNVSKTYKNGTKALSHVDIQIEDGEFVFVLGASGAGKSTFLKLMMREEVPSAGEVVINGYNLNTISKRKIPYFRRTLGIVFQDFRLIPTMRVYDNVAFAMRVIGAKEKDISKRVAYALSLVGLSSKAKVYPNQLSGGEQQRVALARALVNDADIIIADDRLEYRTGDVFRRLGKKYISVSFIAGWDEDTMPSTIRLAVLRIATLMLQETGGNIGLTGKSFADNSRTFVSYSNYRKYLEPLAPLRIRRF